MHSQQSKNCENTKVRKYVMLMKKKKPKPNQSTFDLQNKPTLMALSVIHAKI